MGRERERGEIKKGNTNTKERRKGRRKCQLRSKTESGEGRIWGEGRLRGEKK